MSLNFPEEARKLGGKPDRFGRKRGRLLEADGFDIEFYVYDTQGDWNGLHTCGKDEFFYILKGELEIVIEGRTTILKEKEGILARVGEKHKHRALTQAWILVFSKWPHEHRYYE